MYSAIQTGGSLGMQTLDMCLKGLVAKGLISRENAREKAKILKTSDPGADPPRFARIRNCV